MDEFEKEGMEPFGEQLVEIKIMSLTRTVANSKIIIFFSFNFESLVISRLVCERETKF